MASTLVDPELAAPGATAASSSESSGDTGVRAIASKVDVESRRHPDERALDELLRATEPSLRERFQAPAPAAERARRIASGVVLGPATMPGLDQVLGALVQELGLDLDVAEIEVVASHGLVSAARFSHRLPVSLSLPSRWLSKLDGPTLRWALAVELAHVVAHGDGHASLDVAEAVTRAEATPHLREIATTYQLACRLTADRIAASVCDTRAAATLDVITFTGLAAAEIGWEVDVHLELCRDAVSRALRGEAPSFRELPLGLALRPNARVSSDPIHLLQRETSGAPRLAWPASSPLVPFDPSLVYEAAIAASVLVASADEPLDDAEVDSIERTFAPLVDDISAFFDIEVARARLRASLPILGRLGASAHRSLAFLVLHTITRAGDVHPRELSMLDGVGDAMGGPLVRTIATAAARHLPGRVLAPPGAFAAVESPLGAAPVSAVEGDAAIEAFLATFQRRRGGETTLRQLLMLLGSPLRTSAAVVRINEAVRQARLRTSSDLTTCDLDEPLVLVGRVDQTLPPGDDARAATPLPAAAGALPSPAGALTGPAALVVRALDRLREGLISGDGRSAAIRVHLPRSGRLFDLQALDRVASGRSERTLAQLAQLTPHRAITLIDAIESDASEAGRSVSRDLLALDRECRARFDETGARDLHLGHTFVYGNVGGYLVRAPLVLVPVDLVRVDGSTSAFAIEARDDGSPQINPALLRLLFARKGLALTDAQLDTLDTLAEEGSADAILAELARAGLAITRKLGPLVPLVDRRELVASWSADRLETEPCAALGLYPVSSSELLHDLDALIDAIQNDPAHTGDHLGTALALFPSSLRASLTTPKTLDESLPVTPPGAEDIPVISLDPSQRHVIERARSERLLVVDGPPGTGKSQVIVALVADALSRGERVAVVSDKRAALDVVAQRLHLVGLDESVVLVHDVHDDRRATFDKIAARLDLALAREASPRALTAALDDIHACTQILEARDLALAAQLPSGSAPPRTLGNLHALASSLAVPASLRPLSTPSLAEVTDGDLPQVLSGLIALRPFADLFASSSPWAAKRTSLAHTTPDQRAVHAAAIETAHSAAIAFETAWAATGHLPLAPVIVARGAITAARATRDLRTTPRAQEIFSAALKCIVEAPDRASIINNAELTWNAAASALARFPEKMAVDPGAKFDEHLQTLLRWQSRWPRFLSVAWWEAERAVRAALSTAWPDRAKSTFDGETLDEIAACVVASRAWKTADAALELVGLRSSTPSTVVETGRALAEVALATRAAAALVTARPLLTASRAWPDPPSIDAIAAWDQWLDTLTNAVASSDARVAALKPVQALFPWLPSDAHASQLAVLRSAWARDATRVAEADARLASVTALHREAPTVIAAISTASIAAPSSSESTASPTPLAPPSLADWQSALMRAWAHARIAEIERISPDVIALDRTTPRGDETAVASALAASNQLACSLKRDTIVASLDRQAIATKTSTGNPSRGRRKRDPSAHDEMLHECRKQRRLMPLRAFVRKYARAGLLDVAPVWLVSPETVAALFPQEALFDRVIFDEASQCTVESGLPVLIRGAQAVVVGDEHQMPPSFFFTSRPAEEDTGEPRVDTLVDAPAPAEAPSNLSADTIFDPPSEDPAIRDLLTSESLLTLARSRAPHVGLDWHYRCRSEELIAFSNHAFYAGSLLTIPAPPSLDTTALRWIAVTGGRLERGRNDVEARVVVDELTRLLQRAPRPSVGVVTLNVQQRQAVLDEIDARIANDESFAAVWREITTSARLDDRPFVKNLENVQGDERDVIVLSPGHAPVERKRRSSSAPIELHVPARFGPIGQRGGERRLNVAISRARTEMIVVASFEPDMLSVARAANEGPRLLKLFLSYVFHTSRREPAHADQRLALARRGAPRPTASTRQQSHVPLAVQIASALRREGHDCDLDVGVSSFRIPLALVGSVANGRAPTAILTDEGDQRQSAFDRHVHRPAVLAARGWRVVRVTSRMWARDPAAVIKHLVAPE